MGEVSPCCCPVPIPNQRVKARGWCAMGRRQQEEAGLTIPTDVSVVGYDNTMLAALRHIELTSIDQPGNLMGRSAIDCLAERIDGERSTPRHDVIAPTLVVRSTTGPPRDERSDVLAAVKPNDQQSHHSDGD